MRWIALLVLLCGGCTVTLTGEGRWREPKAASPQLQQLQSALNNMASELKAAPDDIEAINGVLGKYRIQR